MGQYKTAFKAVTFALKPEPDIQSVGKHRGGRRSIVKQINNKMLLSPNNQMLKKVTVYNAVQWGKYRVSPLTNGKQVIVPPKLTHGLACHAMMMQAAGEGEASSHKMRAIAMAVKLGTPFENKFSINYLWKKTRVDHLSLIFPVKATNNKDCCINWLTFKKIINWNKATEEFLVLIGMGTQEQGLVCKLFGFVCIIIAISNKSSCLLLFHFARHGQEQDGSCLQG
jgi:hypothetical protein